MIRNELKSAIKDAIRKKFGEIGIPEFSAEVPENPEHGDYATSIAMVLAKTLKKNPMEIASVIAGAFSIQHSAFSIKVAPPGFINFWLSEGVLQKEFAEILKKKEKYGAGKKKKEKINIEFVSANPTGPLTMANGRGGFYGDVLANTLEKAGYKVTREYYINDAGNQVRLLYESILVAEGKTPEKEEYYKGEYIKDLVGKSSEKAVDILMGGIKKSLAKAGIRFDKWFSEKKQLREKNELKKTLYFLEKKGLLEKRDGAIWLGDGVLVKSDSEPTYFLSDLAYHHDKFIKRKFDIAINIWGADHHGYVERMKKGVGALGVDPSRLRIIIMQLVRLMKGGQEVRMSKRAGEFVTLDELIDEVGLDAARYFFLEKSPDTHMDFNLDLAKERSVKNPVYYIQYAHARISSIFRKAKSYKLQATSFKLLKEKEELGLIKKLIQFPEVVEDTANDYQVHRLTRYAYELARSFHNFYEKQRVITENKELTVARLALVKATQIVLKSALGLLGISAPKRM